MNISATELEVELDTYEAFDPRQYAHFCFKCDQPVQPTGKVSNCCGTGVFEREVTK